MKIVQYKPIKVIISALGLFDVILDMAVQYHSLFNLIVTDRDLLFTSKF